MAYPHASSRKPVPSISSANEISGSQTGSQRRQTLGDAGRRLATMSSASWLFGRRWATSGDGSVASYKRGVTGSNPVAPTRFGKMRCPRRHQLRDVVDHATARCYVSDGAIGGVPAGSKAAET